MPDEQPKEYQIKLPPGATAKAEDQKRIRTARFERAYANSIALGFSQWDVSLLFGELTGQEEEGKVVIEETVQVILTREMAKALAGILLQHLAAFEKRYGEIRIPVLEQAEETPTPPAPATE